MKSLLIVLVAYVAQAQGSGGMYAYTRATTVGSFSLGRPLSALSELCVVFAGFTLVSLCRLHWTSEEVPVSLFGFV